KNRRAWEPLLADQSKFVTDKKLVVLPSYEEVSRDKASFARMSKMFQYETNPHNGRPLLQPHGEEAVYFNPPALPLTEAEMDGLYDLPFARAPH
ncbi:MAG: YgiQ family radical SAM protein, partial [Deltaproteobacteria bacterium]|nr:YgiQ family radical SAM protein [Deltaproteobacteria bacterium]